ncbi:MAG: tubulin-like doman-containing protein [Bacteroidales bacterium]|nr:tubulin-like doman-containing protein [Candidatus Latescibacterota bacterium]
MINDRKHPPTLFIGLGGAGGQIVNRIASILGDRDDWELLQKTMQFFVIDTDKADLDGCRHVPQAHRYAISGFDKGLWVKDKLGRGGASKPDPDPRVDQWIHDWYNFRSSQGAGAGQIRIESRVSLYNSLESTDLIKRLESAILSTIDMQNTMLSYEVKKFNVFMYYTVAGGTGSGAHLMFAAIIRNLINNFGWSANITGISMLSTLVLPKIRNMRQRGDIMANGYSAMKEDEHLMHLKVFSDLRDARNRRSFVYHPFISDTEITESPFDFIYVIDTNPDVFIDNWKVSVADAIYLQLFSPIFAHRNSDYDNYEKNQKRLARGLYSTFYGSYGCSVLVLPDNDLLEYCSMRKTADVIQEHLSARLFLMLPSGKKDYIPKLDDLEGLDSKEQDRLYDEKFVEYMHDRQDSHGGNKYLNELKKAGYAKSLNLKGLQNSVDDLATKPMDEESKSLLYKLILPEDISPENMDVFEGDESGDSGSQPGGGKVSRQYLAKLEPFFFAYNKFGDVLESTLLIEEREGLNYLSTGTFRRFWDRLSSLFFEDTARAVQLQHHRTTRGESAKEESWEDMQDIFDANIKLNRRDLHSAREKVRQKTNMMDDTLKRSFITDFLAHERTPFHMQRLFIIANIKLSDSVCTILRKVLEQNRLDNSEQALNESIAVIRGDEELREASKTKWHEWISEVTRGSGAEDFSQSVERLDMWINTISTRYSTLVFLQFYHDLHAKLLEIFTELGETFRMFSTQADKEIKELARQASEFQKNPGGDTQAEQYYNDIEALQGFDGARMWNEYYNVFVKESVKIRTREVHKTIASVFSDPNLTTVRDQVDRIRIVFTENVKEALRPRIVGTYKEGKEKRGLNLQQALMAEAQLKFRGRLRAMGRLEDCEENWIDIVYSTEKKLLNRSQRELDVEMQRFMRNYLETKISTCVRRSAIMANIDMEDMEVTEYSCKQSLVCYDHDLYPDPKPDVQSLDFPHLVRRVSPEFVDKDYSDNGKMAIFYRAVLGVPLFVFRNLVTTMKEAYNTRLGERDWTRPQHGRQYPLHIDRNWEMGDPGIDESKLPLSLDPEEALVSSSMINEESCKFFSYWYTLYKEGHIIRDDDRGFVVPSGKLGNIGEDILLGQSAREAIQAMMKAHSAHELMEKTFGSSSALDLDEIEKQREFCLSLLSGDVWGNEEDDTEIKELADLLQEYMECEKKKILETKRKEKHRQSYDSGLGKKS